MWDTPVKRSKFQQLRQKSREWVKLVLNRDSFGHRKSSNFVRRTSIINEPVLLILLGFSDKVWEILHLEPRTCRDDKFRQASRTSPQNMNDSIIIDGPEMRPVESSHSQRCNAYSLPVGQGRAGQSLRTWLTDYDANHQWRGRRHNLSNRTTQNLTRKYQYIQRSTPL